MKPVIKGENIVMRISTITNVSIAEIEGRALDTGEEGSMELAGQFEDMLQEDMKNLVMHVQKEFGCDIFGFGNAIRMEYPDVWKEIESDWDRLFQSIEVVTESQVHIENTALSSKPIIVRD